MLSKRMQNLHPYVPGEQPKDRAYIKLNANENPYPPSEEVTVAIKKAVEESPEKLGLYPDPDADMLRGAIADMLNKTGGVLCRSAIAENGCVPNAEDVFGFKVTPDMIFCGNGSDEVLSFVFYTFFEGDRPLVLPEHTYSFYPVYCGYYGIPMQKIALNADWTLNTPLMLKSARETNSSIIFANPNAPTGISLSRQNVREMLRSFPCDKVFVVDEAYCDFGGESAIPLLSEFKNLVIVRTFSKSFSLAGLRLGFIVANPELVRAVFTVKNSFNHFPVDFLAQTAGIASCASAPYYVRNAKAVVTERGLLQNFLREHGWFSIESATNFVFARHPKLSGAEVYEAVKKEGILIRHFAVPGIDDFVRITIGTPSQMAILKGALGKIS